MSSLYTNIDIDEGLTIVEEELEKPNQSRPTLKTLSCLLEKVLKLNREQYIQIKGIAMGTRVAPNFANVYMGRLEDKFVYQTQWANWLRIRVCFIDDTHSLIDFLDYLNNVVPSIKFTHQISIQSLFWTLLS